MNSAYVAGFIDADGCISVNHRIINRNPVGRQKISRSVYFNVSVIVVQKEEKVIKALFDYYGGTINITRRGIHSYYRWSVSGKAVVRLLKDIKPHLIEKKEQAELALKAAIHQAECGRGRYQAGCEGTQPLSKADLDYRESVWHRIKKLNTCHKFHAAAETKSNDPEKGSDSPILSVMTGGAAKAPATLVA